MFSGKKNIQEVEYLSKRNINGAVQITRKIEERNEGKSVTT